MATEEFPFLVDRTVEQIWVWGTFRLVFELGEHPEPDMYVDVDDPVYISSDGAVTPVDLAARPDEAGIVFRLLNKRVVRGSVESGVLSLLFEDGAELRAYPDEQYETWGLIGNGRVFQCMPGGEVDSW
jgi:Family of unknown function (DUF6188)